MRRKGVIMIRGAKETENFPYTMSNVCYFEVYSDGSVMRIPHKNKCDLKEVINICCMAW